MEWSLVNKVVPLYGAVYGSDADHVKIGSRVWEFVCDPDDGYRSYCSEVHEVDGDGIGPFSSNVLAWVTVREAAAPDFDGFELVDAVGHVWLLAGTDGSDDYYPSFVFNWTPPPTP